MITQCCKSKTKCAFSKHKTWTSENAINQIIFNWQQKILSDNLLTYRIGSPLPRELARPGQVMQTLKNPVDDPSLCNLWSFPLKLFTDEAETMSSLNVFHLLTILSEKKCLRSVITHFLCNFRECPFVLSLWLNSKNVLNLDSWQSVNYFIDFSQIGPWSLAVTMRIHPTPDYLHFLSCTNWWVVASYTQRIDGYTRSVILSIVAILFFHWLVILISHFVPVT